MARSCLEPVEIVEGKISRPPAEISYPVVEGLEDRVVQRKVNLQIIDLVRQMVKEQGEFQPGTPIVEMLGTYEVMLNDQGILSILFKNYTYSEKAAHGYTVVRSITLDMCTGKAYQLCDLFKPGSDYVERVSEIVEEQIEERGDPTLEEFTQISPDQDYYLTETDLVLYYQLYELYAYAYGNPYFPIPYTEIADIIDEDGPIGRLIC